MHLYASGSCLEFSDMRGQHIALQDMLVLMSPRGTLKVKTETIFIELDLSLSRNPGNCCTFL